jgi:hypothetical protein
VRLFGPQHIHEQAFALFISTLKMVTECISVKIRKPKISYCVAFSGISISWSFGVLVMWVPPHTSREYSRISFILSCVSCTQLVTLPYLEKTLKDVISPSSWHYFPYMCQWSADCHFCTVNYMNECAESGPDHLTSFVRTL